MKEGPILFSAPMVQALRAGKKTQTRRLVKYPSTGAFVCVHGYWTSQTADEWWPLVSTDGESILDRDGNETPMRCPYGGPGDRRWVRENFTFVNVDRERNSICIAYDADGLDLPTRVDVDVTSEQLADFMGDEREKIDPFKRRRYPGMFMNRWASRLNLYVAGVRVERLLEISAEDAIAEGLSAITKDGTLYKYGIPDSDGLPGTCDYGWPWEEWDVDPRMAYFKLWNKIHGSGAAQKNPWVWVVVFGEVLL